MLVREEILNKFITSYCSFYVLNDTFKSLLLFVWKYTEYFII